MSHRNHQRDVSRTLATHLLLGYLNTTMVTYDTLVTDTLVLTAMALIVLGRTKDTLAEQAVALGLIGTVVDGFGFQHLTIRIFQDLLRGGQSNGNLRKVTLYLGFFSKSHIYCELKSSWLIKCNAQTKSAQLMQQHVKRLGDSRGWHRITLDNGLVCLGTSYHIVRLDGKDLLKHM